MAGGALDEAFAITVPAYLVAGAVALQARADHAGVGEALSPLARRDLRNRWEAVVPDGQGGCQDDGAITLIGLGRLRKHARLAALAQLHPPGGGILDGADDHPIRQLRIDQEVDAAPAAGERAGAQLKRRADRARRACRWCRRRA